MDDNRLQTRTRYGVLTCHLRHLSMEMRIVVLAGMVPLIIALARAYGGEARHLYVNAFMTAIWLNVRRAVRLVSAMKPAATNVIRKVLMIRLVAVIGTLLVMETTAMADKVSFDTDAIGSVPAGWTPAKTGAGNPKWTVEEDPTAPSKAKVVKQSGRATYSLLLKNETSVKNGFVEVRFKAISGSEDRAAGIVWRTKDADNYYVVRANALEDNVVLYKTVDGRRSALDIIGRRGGYGMKIPVPANRWHTLRVEFVDARFDVVFNGNRVFAVEDTTFRDAGMIGLWTKADSVTAFDGVTYGEEK
jgi:hypothetical protein